jgi:hypothetical protein
MTADNWDTCTDGLPHPRKWVDDNMEAIDATEWGRWINEMVDALPDEIVGEPQEPSGGVGFSRRYSDQPEAPLPVPAKPVEDDRDTLQETMRLKQEQYHNPARKPVRPASWQVAKPTPIEDFGEIRPLDW